MALFAPPGSGKSTASGFFGQEADHWQWSFARLRLAEPLYELQSLIYRLCRRPLADPTAQDGQLLAALAQQLRRLRPTVLVDDLADRLTSWEQSTPSGRSSLVVVDDMRPVDVPAMRALDFRLVRIACSAEVAARRHADRRDVSYQPPSQRAVEDGIDGIAPDFTIDNSTTRERLRDEVAAAFKDLA